MQEVMRHSRLQAEQSAHERSVGERDRFIAELAGRLGVNLPGAAGGSWPLYVDCANTLVVSVMVHRQVVQTASDGQSVVTSNGGVFY
jgi:hypothetical protein